MSQTSIAVLQNPHFNKATFKVSGLSSDLQQHPLSTAFTACGELLQQCPAHQATSLQNISALAEKYQVQEVWLKQEQERMGLGSFKALGAAYVIANEAIKQSSEHDNQSNQTLAELSPNELKSILQGKTYVSSSAGNHGLSLAAACQIFGAKACIILSHSVPEAFAQRLREKGAEVIRYGEIYEQGLDYAKELAATKGYILVSDSSWENYTETSRQIMEGYYQLSCEIVQQIPHPPTHIFLQAGVGGVAAALAFHFRTQWGYQPIITVVEPEEAPALYQSIEVGDAIDTTGGVSNMGRLDCKTPSLIALQSLANTANYFCLISDEQAQTTTDQLQHYQINTSPSGAAGIAPFMHSLQHPELTKTLNITPDSKILAVITEEAVKN